MIRKFTLATAASALAMGTVLVLAGCGSSHSASASTPKATSGASSQGGQGTGGQGSAGQGDPGGGAFGGGTFGQIAAVTGQTLQVQDSSSQTAVDFTSSTTITKTVTVSLSSVKAGECVTATSAPTAGASSGSSSSPSAAATTVAISQPTNGSCTSGFGAGAGARSGDRPTARPTLRPSDRPSNRPSGGFRGGSIAVPTIGQVTAVSGSTITVSALDFQTQKTSSKTVTVAATTKYTEEQKGTASDLTVGTCVVARGQSDDTGAVAATALTLSAPVDGTCTSGFGGGGRRGTGPGGAGTGGTGAGAGTQSGTTNG